MKRPTKKQTPHKAEMDLAEKIATSLFTSGNGEVAHKMRLADAKFILH